MGISCFQTWQTDENEGLHTLPAVGAFETKWVLPLTLQLLTLTLPPKGSIRGSGGGAKEATPQWTLFSDSYMFIHTTISFILCALFCLNLLFWFDILHTCINVCARVSLHFSHMRVLLTHMRNRRIYVYANYIRFRVRIYATVKNSS